MVNETRTLDSANRVAVMKMVDTGLTCGRGGCVGHMRIVEGGKVQSDVICDKCMETDVMYKVREEK